MLLVSTIVSTLLSITSMLLLAVRTSVGEIAKAVPKGFELNTLGFGFRDCKNEDWSRQSSFAVYCLLVLF